MKKFFTTYSQPITFLILISISLMGFLLTPFVFYSREIQIETFDLVIVITTSLIIGFVPLLILRLTKAVRKKACLLITVVVFSLYAVELAVQRSDYVTWLFFKVFRNDDTREQDQFIKDMRNEGVPGYIAISLAQIKPFKVRGSTIQVLSGLANKVAVLCDEESGYISYQTDRYGFRNEDLVWDIKQPKIIAVGEPFIHGFCKPTNIVGHIGDLYKNTLNLSSHGAGPLSMLGVIAEYLPRLKPRHILWFHFEGNYLINAEWELERQPLLKYLEKNFRFGIPSLKKEIDKTLSVIIDKNLSDIFEKVSAKRLEQNHPIDVKTHVLPLMGIIDVLLLRNLRRTMNINFLSPSTIPVSREKFATPMKNISAHKFKLFEKTLRLAKHLANQHSSIMHFVYVPKSRNTSSRTEIERSIQKQVLSIAKQVGISIIDLPPPKLKPKRTVPFEDRSYYYNDDGARSIANFILMNLIKETKR